MRLARITNRIWPMLFWLHSTVRGRHLHARLSNAGVVYPVATAARDTQRAASPAEDVWRLHRRPGARLRLASLAHTLPGAERNRALTAFRVVRRWQRAPLEPTPKTHGL